MKKKSLSSQQNFAGFVFFNSILMEFSGIPFFGTLLGLHREGGMIEGDDDVDFYVHCDNRDALTSKMRSVGAELYFEKTSGDQVIFQQYRSTIGEAECLCDVYYFETLRYHLLEKANFGGNPDRKVSHLRIPKSLVFPLRRQEIGTVAVLMPNEPESLVRFLYGRNWRTPLKKDQDYVTRVFFGRPVQFQGKFQFFIYRVLRRVFY